MARWLWFVALLLTALIVPEVTDWPLWAYALVGGGVVLAVEFAQAIWKRLCR